jgi:hypothetical protein
MTEFNDNEVAYLCAVDDGVKKPFITIRPSAFTTDSVVDNRDS